MGTGSSRVRRFRGHGAAFRLQVSDLDCQPFRCGPSLGGFARYVFAAGLFASGLTSAITAPLAAAWAVCGALGWSTDLRDGRLRTVWLVVLVCGTLFAALGSSPVAAILFAQAANGFLLPLVAVFLLLVMNNRTLLGEHRNSPVANLLGAAVVLVATVGNATNEATALAATIFFYARVGHAVVYAAGWPMIRPLFYFASLYGLIIIGLECL